MKFRNGKKVIADLTAPKPEEIDLESAGVWLETNRRFGGNPKALVVADHQDIVAGLCLAGSAPLPVVEWAHWHDCHEGVLGVDIPAPLKAHITGLDAIERALDVAIAQAAGVTPPTEDVYRALAPYDRMACWLEQEYCLHVEPDGMAPAWAHRYFKDVQAVRGFEVRNA